MQNATVNAQSIFSKFIKDQFSNLKLCSSRYKKGLQNTKQTNPKKKAIHVVWLKYEEHRLKSIESFIEEIKAIILEQKILKPEKSGKMYFKT